MEVDAPDVDAPDANVQALAEFDPDFFAGVSELPMPSDYSNPLYNTIPGKLRLLHHAFMNFPIPAPRKTTPYTEVEKMNIIFHNMLTQDYLLGPNDEHKEKARKIAIAFSYDGDTNVMYKGATFCIYVSFGYVLNEQICAFLTFTPFTFDKIARSIIKLFPKIKDDQNLVQLFDKFKRHTERIDEHNGKTKENLIEFYERDPTKDVAMDVVEKDVVEKDFPAPNPKEGSINNFLNRDQQGKTCMYFTLTGFAMAMEHTFFNGDIPYGISYLKHLETDTHEDFSPYFTYFLVEKNGDYITIHMTNFCKNPTIKDNDVYDTLGILYYGVKDNKCSISFNFRETQKNGRIVLKYIPYTDKKPFHRASNNLFKEVENRTLDYCKRFLDTGDIVARVKSEFRIPTLVAQSIYQLKPFCLASLDDLQGEHKLQPTAMCHTQERGVISTKHLVPIMLDYDITKQMLGDIGTYASSVQNSRDNHILNHNDFDVSIGDPSKLTSRFTEEFFKGGKSHFIIKGMNLFCRSDNDFPYLFKKTTAFWDSVKKFGQIRLIPGMDQGAIYMELHKKLFKNFMILDSNIDQLELDFKAYSELDKMFKDGLTQTLEEILITEDYLFFKNLRDLYCLTYNKDVTDFNERFVKGESSIKLREFCKKFKELLIEEGNHEFIYLLYNSFICGICDLLETEHQRILLRVAIQVKTIDTTNKIFIDAMQGITPFKIQDSHDTPSEDIMIFYPRVKIEELVYNEGFDQLPLLICKSVFTLLHQKRDDFIKYVKMFEPQDVQPIRFGENSYDKPIGYSVKCATILDEITTSFTDAQAGQVDFESFSDEMWVIIKGYGCTDFFDLACKFVVSIDEEGISHITDYPQDSIDSVTQQHVSQLWKDSKKECQTYYIQESEKWGLKKPPRMILEPHNVVDDNHVKYKIMSLLVNNARLDRLKNDYRINNFLFGVLLLSESFLPTECGIINGAISPASLLYLFKKSNIQYGSEDDKFIKLFFNSSFFKRWDIQTDKYQPVPLGELMQYRTMSRHRAVVATTAAKRSLDDSLYDKQQENSSKKHAGNKGGNKRTKKKTLKKSKKQTLRKSKKQTLRKKKKKTLRKKKKKTLRKQ